MNIIIGKVIFEHPNSKPTRVIVQLTKDDLSYIEENDTRDGVTTKVKSYRFVDDGEYSYLNELFLALLHYTIGSTTKDSKESRVDYICDNQKRIIALIDDTYGTSVLPWIRIMNFLKQHISISSNKLSGLDTSINDTNRRDLSEIENIARQVIHSVKKGQEFENKDIKAEVVRLKPQLGDLYDAHTILCKIWGILRGLVQQGEITLVRPKVYRKN